MVQETNQTVGCGISRNFDSNEPLSFHRNGDDAPSLLSLTRSAYQRAMANAPSHSGSNGNRLVYPFSLLMADGSHQSSSDRTNDDLRSFTLACINEALAVLDEDSLDEPHGMQ
jgi:hypothetical protein